MSLSIMNAVRVNPGRQGGERESNNRTLSSAEEFKAGFLLGIAFTIACAFALKWLLVIVPILLDVWRSS